MRFLRSVPGAILVILLVGAGAVVAATSVQVHRATHPRRSAGHGSSVASVLVKLEPVRFRSADRVDLAGWFVRGKPGGPAVVLCHDLGESKASLLRLAVALHRREFTLLLLDFRGHGESDGEGSTLGLDEKRDVIAAADFLLSMPRMDVKKLGVYGVGLGAHAAVLAARERPALRVLALDGLYPDVGYPLVRSVFVGWSFGIRHLGFLPESVFDVLSGSRIAASRAADVLPALRGRDILLVAPAGDSSLAREIERLYEAIPQGRDNEASLVTLPANLAGGLYGEDLDRYHVRVATFFEVRLARV